jgi:hypothetical protein
VGFIGTTCTSLPWSPEVALELAPALWFPGGALGMAPSPEAEGGGGGVGTCCEGG